MNDVPVAVLGAGPAGVAAGLALGDLGVVLEAGPDVGGLCRTLEFDGAIFDLGGHSFHTPHPDVHDLVFGALAMFEQKRDARCFVRGQLIPYPFQQHFQQIPDPVLVSECAAGLEGVEKGAGTDHFEGYLRSRFGPGIARHFLLPYNRKLWKIDLREMTADWAGERVAGAAGNDGDGAFARTGGRRTPLRDGTTVAYPACGGYDEILKALAGRLRHLQLRRSAVRIDPHRRQLTFEDGETLRWGRLVSTIPLPRLLSITDGVPTELLEAAGRLRSLPMAMVLAVVGHPVDTPVQRVYSADADCPAHKIVVNHNSSDYLRSLPHHGIMAEVSLPPGQAQPGPDLERSVVQSLAEMSLVKHPREVRRTRVIVVADGYPVPTHDRDRIVATIRAWLADRGIFTVGRFAEWAYINADEALARGLALGRALEGDPALRRAATGRVLRPSSGAPEHGIPRPHFATAAAVDVQQGPRR
jgi:protoporphyrinogen oxidase